MPSRQILRRAAQKYLNDLPRTLLFINRVKIARVAQALKLSRGTVSMILNGNLPISERNLIILSAVLHIDRDIATRPLSTTSELLHAMLACTAIPSL